MRRIIWAIVSLLFIFIGASILYASGSVFTLYSSFTDNGIWQWDSSGWSQLTPDNPEGMVAVGTSIYGDFGGNGLWKWDSCGWRQLTPDNPEAIAASRSSLYGDFGSNGIWQWNGSNWSQLTPDNPETMAVSGLILYADFGSNGLWQWNGGVWNFLTPDNPEAMVTAGWNLYADFGSNGLWQFNGSGWSLLTPDNPANMSASGIDVFGSFAGGGVWKWSNNSWSQVTSDEPASLASTGAFDGDVITFVTEGSSFAPVIVVAGTPEILWTWADGTTSNSATPVKDYGTAGKRLNTLSVKPWSSIQRINIGYDAGDGGSTAIEYVADQHVSSVEGLELIAPYLAQWCSSYNELDSLNFSNFTNLDTIECYWSQTLSKVSLVNTPKLKRACFENCNLASLDLSGSPLLEDLRGALNNYPAINFGSIGAHVWHICVRDNPQMNNRNQFADMTPFPGLSEFFIWNDHQTGNLRIPATSPTNYVSLLADGNQYTSLNFSGALQNANSQGILSFRDNSISSIDFTGCSQITELYLENNLLDSTQLDTLLATLDSLGRNSFNTNPDMPLTVNIQGNADPGTEGYNHAVNLASKGWTVLATSWTLDPPPPEPTNVYFSTTGDTTGMRCDFSGTATTATWHWSDGTTSVATSGADIVKSGLGEGTHGHYLTISNSAALRRFGGSGWSGQGHLTSITGFDKTTHLNVLYVYNESGLATLGRTNTTRINEYHTMGTALSASAMDQIFADAVAIGVTNGTLWCNNMGTSASDTDRAILVSRGWSLY